MKLIIGLGNPGEKYEKTRHNLGFMAVDVLARKEGRKWTVEKKFNSEVCRLGKALMIKPQTMMNASGVAVGKIASFYKILPGDIWVVHDDIDLPMGKIKIVLGRGAAGHRGVESIIEVLGNKEFVRFRGGIMEGKIPIEKRSHVDAERFVLRPFERGEGREVKRMIKRIGEAIEVGLKRGLSVAMNKYN